MLRIVCLIFIFMAAGLAFADTLVVLNKSGASASLIDLATGKISATLPTGEGPHEVAVSSDGKLAIATNYGTRTAPGNSLTLIDIPGAKVVKTISLGDYSKPHGIMWLSDNRRVLITAEAQKSLLLLDTESQKVERAIVTGQEVSHMVAATPDEKRAFVANIGSGSVTAVDLDKGTVLKNIETGAGAEGIAVSPDGTEVWVTNREANTVSVIDAKSLEIIGSVPSSSFPIRAEFTPDGKYVLVSNARSGSIVVIDRVSRKAVRTITIAESSKSAEGRLFGDRFGDSPVPIGIAVAPGGDSAYIALSNADHVAILDLQQWKITGTLPTGKEPDGVGYSGR